MKLIVAAFIGRGRIHAENDASGIPSLSVMLEKLTIKSRVSPAISQTFGSIPRLSSSRRNRRFIHPERLSSPSSFMAVFSLSKRSASSLSCTANRSFLLSSVDIVNLETNNELKVTMYTSVTTKTTPRTVGAVPRRLTSNVIGVTPWL